MQIDKLKTFLGIRKPTKEQKEMEAIVLKMVGDAEGIKAMQNTRGWKLLDEFFTTKKSVLSQEIKLLDPWKEPEKIARCQEKYKIIDELYNFMNSKILRGS